MSKYGRQHSGPNASPGIIWILILCVASVIIWRVVARYKQAKQIHAIEVQEIQDRQQMIDTIFIQDSSGK